MLIIVVRRVDSVHCVSMSDDALCCSIYHESPQCYSMSKKNVNRIHATLVFRNVICMPSNTDVTLSMPRGDHASCHVISVQ